MFQATYTRDKLRGLAEETRNTRKRQQLDNYYSKILPQVVKAAQDDNTSVIVEFNPTDFSDARDHRALLSGDEIITYLCERFPGCIVEIAQEWVDQPPARAGPPTVRFLKKGMKIDWS